MGDVIDLLARTESERKYAERLEAILQHLNAASGELWDDLVNLAMLGPWRAWNGEQPADTCVHVDTNALIECGDAKVVAIAALLRHMEDVARQLQGERADSRSQ